MGTDRQSLLSLGRQSLLSLGRQETVSRAGQVCRSSLSRPPASLAAHTTRRADVALSAHTILFGYTPRSLARGTRA